MFARQDRNLAQLEFKFTREVLENLVVKLRESRQLVLSSSSTEPDVNLFILEHATVPELPIKLGLIWPDQRKRASSAGRALQSQRSLPADFSRDKDRVPYMLKASIVKHALTREGLACIEFRVRKWREDASGRGTEHLIHVFQNNHNFVTEVRIVGDVRNYEICHVSTMTHNRIKVMLYPVPSESWVLQFENLFKLH